MKLPDADMRSACQERCAEFGDPPCYEIDRRNNNPFTACSECLADCGGPAAAPLDPDAVIAPLF